MECKMAKIVIESDGTYKGTKISVDEQVIEFKRTWFSAGADGKGDGWANLELTVERVDRETGLPYNETLLINKDGTQVGSSLAMAVAQLLKKNK